jgi:FkbM family methyltransferase
VIRPRLRSLRDGIRYRIAQAIAPRDRRSDQFYRSTPTCQVPELSSLFTYFLGNRHDGVFVEIGANDGVFVSNTWGLAEQGWAGFMVEPVPELASACRRNHGTHPNVRVFERAISSPGVDELRLHVAGTMTTGSDAAFEEFQKVEWAREATRGATEITVPCSTLDSFLNEYGVAPGFDVLVVDVEGLETEVFSGFDVTGWQPKIMIVEILDTHPDLTASVARERALSQHILEGPYAIGYKDQINTVFVHHDVWASGPADHREEP